jgi:tetratricopeptide (TPR) repeat protein
VAHLQRGNLAAAATAFENTLNLRPNDADALNQLGFVQLRQRRLDDAEATLQRALEINPRLTSARLNLATVKRLKGENDEALRLYQQVVAENPKSQEARLAIGDLLMEKGDLRGAEAQYRAVLKENERSHVAWNNSGACADALQSHSGSHQSVGARRRAEPALGSVPQQLGRRLRTRRAARQSAHDVPRGAQP